MEDIERAVDDGVNTFKALTAMIALYQELVPRKLNWLSRYPALERYVELQVLTYTYQCHSAFGFKVVKPW